MLEIKGLDKYFNQFRKNQIHVINNLNLTLDDNGLIALLGPSGCGKTTLLNVLGGLDTSRKGKIYLNGKKINSKFMFQVDKMRNIRIGYIFQDYKLIDDMSVYDNVALVLLMLGIKDKKEIKKRVEFILDKVGMLRYKKRPAGMLSGGERQRVGIARALVKDPEIILADEPTGNLDSKNSLEIMKIIKAISKEKLVILVTHEASLAKFYASRIIEIKDGTVIADYLNEHTDELDYALDNCFYLKDFKNKKKLDDSISIYSDTDNQIELDIVVKGKNIYIKTGDNYKLEVVDQNSSIEMIDDHYKKIAKKDIDLYEFNFKDIINNNYKKKYKSIINPFKMIKLGFQKVFGFSILKKLLLIGFFIAAMFIMYSFSTLFSCYSIKDSYFVTKNKNYLLINSKNITVDNYLKYETLITDGYLIPGDSIIKLKIKSDDYYQTSQSPLEVNGSLASVNMINKENIIYGRMPVNNHEIVIDEMVVNNILNGDNPSKMRGIYSGKELLDRKIEIDNLNDYTLVGIVSTNSPSIYTYQEEMLDILANSKVNTEYVDDKNVSSQSFIDYKWLNDKIEIKKGRLPLNDYEVMVNIDQAEEYPINKKIKTKINGNELLVVGYYYNNEGKHDYLVNSNMIKYNLINNSTDITVYCKEKESCLKMYRENNLNIVDTYEDSKNNYLLTNSEMLNNAMFISIIILIISFVEIILMIRSSFLSRIKEVGIYRAIGIKRFDIYKMFFGEIFAITTLASLPGILLMSYILSKLSTISMMERFIYIKPWVTILAIICVYGFNLIVGLLPVYNTMRKRPATILARHDLD